MRLSCVALDLETTGLDAERDSIIEIGCVKWVDGNIVEEWSSLVNPGRHIPLKISQITGIVNADVAGAPALPDLAPRLLGFLGDLPIVGHNIGFDLAFLQHQGLYRNNPAVDTFDLATVLLPRQNRYTLTSLAATFQVELADAHRALDDARASLQLLVALVDYGSRLPAALLAQINGLIASGTWQLRPLFAEMARLAIARAFNGAQARAAEVVPGRAVWTSGNVPPPLQPVSEPQKIDVDATAALLLPDGAASRVFPHYEFRAPQVDMLRAVTQAFNARQHLIVEAGTGTGKSLAYLLPAVLHALENGQRVVVSTNTINLQDQLYRKDIPDLQKLLSTPFRAALVKGRSNYLCPRRFNYLRQRSDLNETETRVLVKILIWLQHTETGDRDELMLHGSGETAAWNRVAADRTSCTAARCLAQEGGPCFFHHAHSEAEAAHVVIVNHALLLADIAVENRVLPRYQHLIVDEAHHLVDAITQQLGFEVSGPSFLALLNDLYPAGGGRGGGLLNSVRESLLALPPAARAGPGLTWLSRCQEEIESCRQRLPDFLHTLHSFLNEQNRGNPNYDLRIRLTSATRAQALWDRVEIQWDNLGIHLRQARDLAGRLAQAVGLLAQQSAVDFETLAGELARAARRLAEADEQVSALVSNPDANGIYWLELSAENEREAVDPVFRISLHAAPLQVGGLVEQVLLREKDSVILTSATLRTAGSFDFLAERLHMWDIDALAVGSPFDYTASTLLCLPTDIPEPNAQGYQQAVERAILELARATDGRMLVLFTAYNQLKRTRQALSAALAQDDIVIFEQGSGTSRRQLMENFKNTDRALLFGTRSFWEGVDIVGDALSCLVITRLPFAVPSDPVFAARSEAVEEPFYNFAVPDAILRFRQGFGRLIRSRSDRGVCVILDRRVLSKQYGQQFIDSLPTCTTVRSTSALIPEQAQAWLARK